MRPVTGFALLLCLTSGLAPASAQRRPPAQPIYVEQRDVTFEGGSAVRLIPPPSRNASGTILLEVLLLDPRVRQLVFYVDGKERSRAKRPPWREKLKLENPPREQVVRVEALDLLERVIGDDELTFNKVTTPLKVEIRSLEHASGKLAVSAFVSIPDIVELENVQLWLNDRQVGTFGTSDLEGGTLEAAVDAAPPSPSDYVRVVAKLADGRAVEDTQLVTDTQFQEEIDVRLVQLQVLVTDKQGRPLKGFRKEHFQIKDAGGLREPAGLFAANDVSLLFGYALDSSGSMQPIWKQTISSSRQLLDATLSERDEAFLVDFDWHIRLVEGRTPDRAALEAGLDSVQPDGGTALYDAVLFSLLQFDGQQGRRGLVVLTDGYDADSRSNPERTVELAQRLGVPIYIVALEARGPGAALTNPPLGFGTGPSAARKAEAALAELRLLTDPTGGRFIRVATSEQVRQAFAQISAEMRNQYVLTYYTDTPPQAGKPPEVIVLVEGMKGLVPKVTFGADQIY